MMLGRFHLSAMGEYDVVVGQVSNLITFMRTSNPIIVTDENVAKLPSRGSGIRFTGGGSSIHCYPSRGRGK
jgi:hypothetical protein